MNYKDRKSFFGLILRGIVVCLAVWLGISIYSWNRNGARKLESLEALRGLKAEIDHSREIIEKIVAAHIKVKEASVELLDELAAETPANMAEIDKLDLMARRNFAMHYSQRQLESLIERGLRAGLVSDTLEKMARTYPDLLNDYRELERISERFYNEEFLPFLIRELPLYTEADVRQKAEVYMSMNYRNLVKSKMELTIHVLYQGQIIKNFSEKLSARIEEELSALTR